MAKNNSYWESRVQKIYDKRVEELAVDILYRRVYEDTAKQVRELYEDSKDRKLTRTELYRSAKFLSWRRDLKKQLKGISGEVNDKLEKTLTKAYKDAGLAAKDSIGKKSVWTVQNREMAKACINREWAGDSFSGRIWKNRDKLARTVERGIVNTIITGTGKNELIKELTDLKYRDRFTADPSSQLPIEQQYEAYLQRGRRQANTLVRTELMHTLNTAQIETYKSEGVNYLAFECEPTACSKCRDIASGNPYKIDSIPCTLGHPNCRCTWLAVEDEDVEDVRKKFKHDITKPNTAENSANELTNGGNNVTINMGYLSNATNLGRDHADAMKGILETAPQSAQNVWNKYANDLNVVNAHAKGKAYCQWTKGVTFDIDEIAKGERTDCRIKGAWEQAKKPYYTAFHEFGHNISALAAKDITGRSFDDMSLVFESKKYTFGGGLFSSHTQGYTLSQMIKEEGGEYVDSVWSNLKKQAKGKGLPARSVRKQDAWNYIKQEILKEPVVATSDVSDMWCGISRNSCVAHYGHKKPYWNDVDVGIEAFAEMFSATVMNPDSVKQIQRYFPKSYDIFLEILDEIGG